MRLQDVQAKAREVRKQCPDLTDKLFEILEMLIEFIEDGKDEENNCEWAMKQIDELTEKR